MESSKEKQKIRFEPYIWKYGDTFQLLASKYYSDPKLWWVIASANVSKNDGLIVKPGVQLRVPYRINEVLEEFERVNRER